MMKRLWMWFLARFRLSNVAICSMSIGLPEDSDYHDYKDTKEKYPTHFETLTCERCGKTFII